MSSILTEILAKEAKLALVAEMGKRVPASLNYHDLMVQLTDEEWRDYRVFRSADSSGFVYGGISPEGNLNVYGESDPAILSMAQHLCEVTGQATPPFFRSNIEGLGAVGTLPALNRRIQVIKVIRSMRVATEALEPPAATFKVRAAKNLPADLAHIRYWYDNYNLEMGTSYRPPDPGQLGSRGLYLMTDESDQLLGAVAHTVLSPHRFWLGRFFIFKEFRRRKLGKQLLLGLSQAAGLAPTQMHLHVYTDNASASSFYKTLGFEEAGILFYAKYYR